MAGNITDEQVSEFKGIFEFFGVQGETPIKKSEIQNVMRALGQNPTELEMKMIMEEIEADGDKPITFQYFLSLYAKNMQDKDAERELIKAFNVFDKSHNGRISVEDFRSIVNNLGEKLTKNEINEIIREADQDGDGDIDYMEFVRMMMNK